MTPAETIKQALAMDIHLAVDGGNIRFACRNAALPAELRQAIATHKEPLKTLLSARDQSRQDLMGLYSGLATTCTAADWTTACALPGWKDELHRLEEAFSTAWTAGQDCRHELDHLSGHWHRGTEKTRGKA